MLLGIAMSSLFGLMPALGANVATILVGRFFGGLFGVAPVAIFGGVLSDCWPLTQRGIAMALAVSLVFSGPTWGPILGGFVMGSPSLDWRWNMWVVVIAGLGASLLCVFVYPETYMPAILRGKARALRRKSRNPNIRTASDEEGLNIQEIAKVYLIRPFWLFMTQPILALLTLYQSFVYGVMFLFYQTYPVAFGEDRQWSTSLKNLPLLAIICGTFAGAIGIIFHNQLYFRHHCHAADGTYIPESRLPPMTVGCVMVPIGMFWFAWTVAPAVSWASPICASFLTGCGMYLLFIQGWNYIVDCYTNMANSAMGVNGSVRSVFGAVFPLFANQMVHALGVAKTTTILGAVSVALVPVPICFWYWGHRIRAWSSAKVASKIGA
ncbi:major facilitator superfamily domain-containing protein [Aspergillus falconensis]